MKITKVERYEDIRKVDDYAEFEGDFYAPCWCCGKPVLVDWHRTRHDLEHDIQGEEEYFCSETCRKDWWKSVDPDWHEEE